MHCGYGIFAANRSAIVVVSLVGRDATYAGERGVVMNRRDFVVCGTGAAAALGVAAWGAAGAAEAERSRSVPGRLPSKVIVDRRFQESRGFGHAAARLGCSIRPISGDVTSLWFNELQPLWARGEGEIVGMTTPASLMCLEQLAWNQWMRVVARVEHRSEPDGTVRHRLFLKDGVLQEAQVALAGLGPWSEQAAAALMKSLEHSYDGRPLRSVVVTSQESRSASGISLTSWVIAARASQAAPTRLNFPPPETRPT
jgi:hypothetical protein